MSILPQCPSILTEFPFCKADQDMFEEFIASKNLTEKLEIILLVIIEFSFGGVEAHDKGIDSL
jgi:hypothetical protein